VTISSAVFGDLKRKYLANSPPFALAFWVKISGLGGDFLWKKPEFENIVVLSF
jgi:hypothetical protein